MWLDLSRHQTWQSCLTSIYRILSTRDSLDTVYRPQAWQSYLTSDFSPRLSIPASDSLDTGMLIRASHDSFMCVRTHLYLTWLICMCDCWFKCETWPLNTLDTVMLIHIYDISHRHVTWLVQMGHGCFFTWYDAFVCKMNDSHVTWLVRMWHDSFVCDMTRSYVIWLVHVWHDSSVREITHSYAKWNIKMWHDSFVCDMTRLNVTWLIHIWHDSFVCDMTRSNVTWLICMWHDSVICDMTYVWRDSYVTWFIDM